MNPKVDIILPIYKPDKKVYKAINSVLNQTYANWHLYIIDDASKDDSLELIKKKYQDFNTKITYLQLNKNRRAAGARNYAINKGKGEFISFIDQDDIWINDKLKQQTAYLKKTGLDIVHGNLLFIDNSGNIIRKDTFESENNTRRKINWSNIENLELANMLLLRPNIRIISAMIRRNIFQKIGGYKEQFFGGEDMILFFELAMKGQIGYIDKVLFKRRFHKNNTVIKNRNVRLKGYIKALHYLKHNYTSIDHSIYKKRLTSKEFAMIKTNITRRKIIPALIGIIRLLMFNPIFFFKYFKRTLH